jgi:hypothetical protein
MHSRTGRSSLVTPDSRTGGAQRQPPRDIIDGEDEQDPAFPAGVALVAVEPDQGDRDEDVVHENLPLSSS